MFNKLKGVLNGITSLDDPGLSAPIGSNLPIGAPMNFKKIGRGPCHKYRYTRPSFLKLEDDEEIQVSADQVIRPIIVPRDGSRLPWNAGYAELVVILLIYHVRVNLFHLIVSVISYHFIVCELKHIFFSFYSAFNFPGQ